MYSFLLEVSRIEPKTLSFCGQYSILVTHLDHRREGAPPKRCIHSFKLSALANLAEKRSLQKMRSWPQWYLSPTTAQLLSCCNCCTEEGGKKKKGITPACNRVFYILSITLSSARPSSYQILVRLKSGRLDRKSYHEGAESIPSMANDLYLLDKSWQGALSKQRSFLLGVRIRVHRTSDRCITRVR